MKYNTPLNFVKKDSETCIIGFKENIPIIAVWDLTFATVGFWCPYCNKLHRHGKADGHPNGHRCAHCSEQTPFSETGYIIVLQDNQQLNTKTEEYNE